jgi:hypothetical protein
MGRHARMLNSSNIMLEDMHVDVWKNSCNRKTKSEESFTRRWTAPRPETVKINIDVAFRESSGNNGGWGGICRNNDSEVCFAVSGSLVRMRDAFHAEATALSHAIQVANSSGVGRVVFETNCINLKYAMTTNDYSLATIGNSISDLKYQLRMGFIEASAVYVSRSCNKAAHELAALGAGVAEQTLWMTGYPIYVTSLVTGDVAVS